MLIPEIKTSTGILYNATIEQAQLAGVAVADIAAAIDTAILRQSMRQIDDICDQIYTRSPSRNARYDRKYAEALKLQTAGWPSSASATNYPYLAAESTERGLTMRAMAESVIAAAAGFDQIGAAAEAARAKLKNDVPAATDSTAKQQTADAIVATIAALANQ